MIVIKQHLSLVTFFRRKSNTRPDKTNRDTIFYLDPTLLTSLTPSCPPHNTALLSLVAHVPAAPLASVDEYLQPESAAYTALRHIHTPSASA